MIAYISLFTFAVARADSIELNDGTKVEGEIQDLSNESVTISIESPQGSGVFLEQRFPKTQVKHIEREDAESAEFESIKSMDVPQTADETKPYDEMLRNKIAPFLQKYPHGKFSSELNALSAKLETERERIIAGECKVSGVWMTRQQADGDPETSAAIHLARMERAPTAISAMIAFDDLEKKHATSACYPAAVQIARVKIEQMAVEISRAKLDLARKLREREQGLQLASEDSRIVMEKGIAQENDATKAAIARAKQEGRKWLPLLPDTKLLDDLAKRVESEKKRLDGKDSEKMSRAVAKAHEAQQQLNSGDLTAARQSIQDASRSWPQLANLATLEQSLKRAESKTQASTPAETQPESRVNATNPPVTDGNNRPTDTPPGAAKP